MVELQGKVMTPTPKKAKVKKDVLAWGVRNCVKGIIFRDTVRESKAEAREALRFKFEGSPCGGCKAVRVKIVEVKG